MMTRIFPEMERHSGNYPGSPAKPILAIYTDAMLRAIMALGDIFCINIKKMSI